MDVQISVNRRCASSCAAKKNCMTVVIVSHNLMKLREALLWRAVALNEQWPSSVTFNVTDVKILHADLDAGALKTLLGGSPGSSDAVCDQTCEPGFGLFVVRRFRPFERQREAAAPAAPFLLH